MNPNPKPLRTCQFCKQPIGVMVNFFTDARTPWCLDCWLHGPANPKQAKLPELKPHPYVERCTCGTPR